MPPRASAVAGLAALAGGVLAALAFPPFGFLPGLAGFALILWSLDRPAARPVRAAAARGALAGVGYFSVSVVWVVEPFLVDERTYGWMAPFALVLMAGGLSLFWAAAAALWRRIGARGLPGLLAFAACLSGTEWLRGHVLTGFPWNLPGEAWPAGSPLSQVAALVGAYGLTWVTLALCASPVWILEPGTPRRRFARAAAVAGAFLALHAWGATRIAATPQAPTGPVIRIVQADIDQKTKWRPENLPGIFQTYLELSARPSAVRPDLVVWPEGALPAVINDLLAPGSPWRAALARTLAPGQLLAMGAYRADMDARQVLTYHNSLILLQGRGEDLALAGLYDKHRLVPFAEFMPLGDLAGRIGLRSLVHMPEDFTAGPPPRPLSVADLPAFQPMICYEALFPGFTRAAARRAGQRPDWILNVSNDAWFGRASGPWQHLNMARYRAIEEGLPIVRSTPTGVSTVIDSSGRTVGPVLGLGASGVIDLPLPPPRPPTPYSRWGDLPFLVLLLLSAAGLAGHKEIFIGLAKRRPLRRARRDPDGAVS
ncbi:MAG: apolipoprotein N-acyltransferase [Alphaproteobacteria bacterium]